MGKIISSYDNMILKSFNSKLRLFLYKLDLEGREKFTAEEFHKFKSSDDLARIFNQRNWKDCLTHASGENRNVCRTCDLREKSERLFNYLEYEYRCDFDKIFPKEEFEKLMKIQKCHYCGITEDEISMLAEKGNLFNDHPGSRKLKIQRKNPNLEYTSENCVKSCYWCRKAKNNEFTEDEFKGVAKAISDIWRKRRNRH